MIFNTQTDAVGIDACAVLRPNWNGTETSAFAEMLFVFAEPISLLLLLASVAIIYVKSFRGALANSVLWAIWTGYVVATYTLHDPIHEGFMFGCVGSIAFFVVSAIALCLAKVMYTAYHKFFRTTAEAQRCSKD